MAGSKPTANPPSPHVESGLAFFDMDRTLVRKNTANLYAKWRLSRGEIRKRDWLRATKWLLQYSLGVIDAEKVTAKALISLEGQDEDQFRVECEEWFAAVVRPHVTDAARNEVAKCKRDGMTCVVLSASTPYATGPLARELGIEHVLCTVLEIKDGKFTGRYEEPLCYGKGKYTIAERWANAHGFDVNDSTFYTDSISDLPMLEKVAVQRIINPDPRLAVLAKRRGWRVDRWM